MALATMKELETSGHGESFDVFIVSDTTDPDIWVHEEAAFKAARARPGNGPRLYYRRRAANTGKKAGNIADWCRRWGPAYDYMLVLDADSLMTGASIVQLAHIMDRQARSRPAADRSRHHRAQHAVRPHAAIRRRPLRPDHGDGPCLLASRHRQFLGPQRHHSRARLHGIGRPAASARLAPLRRPDPQPRFRRGRADVPGGLARLHGARDQGLLRGDPAQPDRFRHARPPLVPGQSSAQPHHRRQGPAPDEPGASGHGHHGLYVRADLAAVPDHRPLADHPAAHRQADLFRRRPDAVPDLADAGQRARHEPPVLDADPAAAAESVRPGRWRCSTARSGAASAASGALAAASSWRRCCPRCSPMS